MTEAACVAVVLDAARENFLLVKRRDVPIWVLPGGAIDPGESPEDATVREVREESGLEVRIVRKVALYSPTGRLSCDTHLFECVVVGGESGSSDETSAASFFPNDAYPPPVFEIHLNWLKDTLRNLDHVIEKPIEGLGWRAIFRMIFRHPILSCRFLLTKIGIRFHSS